MNLSDIIVLSIGLAMDAFAVAICKGLSMKQFRIRYAFLIAFYFGAFQAGMPLLGYLLGTAFASFVASIDHWVAFLLLGLIGANMIKESFSEEEHIDERLDTPTLILLAIATSIDALAAGVTFAFLPVSVYTAVAWIGILTFLICFCGVYIGKRFGTYFRNKAEFAGGAILILLGLRILLEHLGILHL